jgi:hypothetical protein
MVLSIVFADFRVPLPVGKYGRLAALFGLIFLQDPRVGVVVEELSESSLRLVSII